MDARSSPLHAFNALTSSRLPHTPCRLCIESILAKLKNGQMFDWRGIPHPLNSHINHPSPFLARVKFILIIGGFFTGRSWMPRHVVILATFSASFPISFHFFLLPPSHYPFFRPPLLSPRPQQASCVSSISVRRGNGGSIYLRCSSFTGSGTPPEP